MRAVTKTVKKMRSRRVLRKVSSHRDNLTRIRLAVCELHQMRARIRLVNSPLQLAVVR